jgi:hypothetical protein
VVVQPSREPLARSLAIGLVSEVVALGGRGLLVDADVDRPVLSARLGGIGRPGLVDLGAEVELSQVIRRVNPLRLPRVARRMVGADVERLRFVPAGRLRRRRHGALPLAALDRVDPEVTTVVLAPPVDSGWSMAALLGWADVVVLAAAVGRTTTSDLEDSALAAHTLTAAPTGVVLIDG